MKRIRAGLSIFVLLGLAFSASLAYSPLETLEPVPSSALQDNSADEKSSDNDNAVDSKTLNPQRN